MNALPDPIELPGILGTLLVVSATFNLLAFLAYKARILPGCRPRGAGGTATNLRIRRFVSHVTRQHNKQVRANVNTRREDSPLYNYPALEFTLRTITVSYTPEVRSEAIIDLFDDLPPDEQEDFLVHMLRHASPIIDEPQEEDAPA